VDDLAAGVEEDGPLGRSERGGDQVKGLLGARAVSARKRTPRVRRSGPPKGFDSSMRAWILGESLTADRGRSMAEWDQIASNYVPAACGNYRDENRVRVSPADVTYGVRGSDLTAARPRSSTKARLAR
jgi:hypothetical protein